MLDEKDELLTLFISPTTSCRLVKVISSRYILCFILLFAYCSSLRLIHHVHPTWYTVSLQAAEKSTCFFLHNNQMPRSEDRCHIIKFLIWRYFYWRGGSYCCRLLSLGQTLNDLWDKAKQISTSRGKQFHHNNLCDSLLEGDCTNHSRKDSQHRSPKVFNLALL